MNSKNTKPEMTYGQAMNGLNFEGLSEHATVTVTDYIKRRVRTLNALVLDCKTLMECGASKQEIAANKQMITLTKKFLSTDALENLMSGAAFAEGEAEKAAAEAATEAEVKQVHEIVAAVVKPKKATKAKKAKKVEQEPVAEAEASPEQVEMDAVTGGDEAQSAKYGTMSEAEVAFMGDD